jgi:hypothetical protein
MSSQLGALATGSLSGDEERRGTDPHEMSAGSGSRIGDWCRSAQRLVVGSLAGSMGADGAIRSLDMSPWTIRISLDIQRRVELAIDHKFGYMDSIFRQSRGL